MDQSTSSKILVVDDDEAIQSVLQAALEFEGYEVTCAESGEKALELLLNEKIEIHLIFLDLYMPGMNGFEFANRLKEQGSEVQKKIPIVVTSATNRRAEKEAALAFEGYLQKPFALDRLFDYCKRFAVYPDASSSSSNEANLLKEC